MDDLLLLLLGLAGLWGGTRLAVTNSVALARALNVSEMVIGLTLLAFGTDLPELFVSIDGALHNLRGRESSGVVVGNAIGSSVCQISLVIGLTAFFHYLAIGRRQIRNFTIELLGSCLLLFLVGFDGKVTRVEGIILLVAFLIYLATLLNEPTPHEEDGVKRPSWIRTIGLTLLGLGIVLFSSDLTVDKAILLSSTWGIKQSFVGAIIVGLGTSLPELAISLRAISEKRAHLSIGNIIGSNIFDLLIPVGIASTISELRFARENLLFDLPFLAILTAVVLWFLSRTRGLQHYEGIGLIVLYLFYVVGKYTLSVQ